MVATVVNEVDIGLLEFGNHCREIFVACVDAFEHSDLVAFALYGLLDRGGYAFAVLLLVVDHGNVFRLNVISNEVACGWALQAVQTDGAEDQLVTTVGDFRASRGRGNHDDAFVFIDIRRWLSGAGAQVTDDVFYFVVNDLVSYCHGLFRIAGVVIDHTFEHCAVDAASLVDLLDGHLGANELHLAILGNSASYGAG